MQYAIVVLIRFELPPGSYKPAVNDPDSTFFFDRPFALYGGYPDSGNPNDLERDPFNHPTILSGSIGNLYDSLDNTRNIVTVIGIKDSAIIDGFIIRNACHTQSIGINSTGGGGLFLYNNHSNIKNCQFINNYSFPSGGAIYISRLTSSRISHCFFFNNSASNSAGAIWFQGSNLNITDCIFEKKSLIWRRWRNKN